MRRALFKTSAATDLVYFQAYESERSVNLDGTVGGEIYLKRITLEAEGSYLNSRQRPNFEIDVRARRVEHAVGAGVDFQVTPKFRVGLQGRQSKVMFDADAVFDGTYLKDTLNRDSRALSGAVRYHVTPLTTVVVRTEASEERFRYAPLRDADVVSVMPGVEIKPMALIAGHASVGYKKFRTLSRSLADFEGVVASARLSYRFLGSTVFAVSADRDLSYSYRPLEPYYVVDGYGVSVRRQIVARLDVIAGTHWHRGTYRDLRVAGEDAAATPPAFTRVEVTRTHSGSIGYRLGPDTRLGVGVDYWRRKSNALAQRDYSGLRFGTSLNYGF
jgi:hypothetical protein